MTDSTDEQEAKQKILRTLDSANAIGPSSAKTLHELKLPRSAALAALVERGFVCTTSQEPERFYFSKSSSVFLPRSATRWSLIAACVGIVIVIWLFVRLVTRPG